MLSKKAFEEVMRRVPLVFVDVILSKKNGELLLGKRKNVPYQHEWFFVGGRVRRGESPQEAAVREVLEETSIRVDPSSLHLVTVISRTYSEIDRHDIVITYAATVADDVKPKQNAEHSELRFFKKLPNLRPEALDIIREYEKTIKR